MLATVVSDVLVLTFGINPTMTLKGGRDVLDLDLRV